MALGCEYPELSDTEGMMEIHVSDFNSFVRLTHAKLTRIAHEAGDAIRLTFSDDKRNAVQIEMLVPDVNKLKERLNKRKDF